MCYREKRRESDTVPPRIHSLEGGQKVAYGEGLSLNQEKVCMKRWCWHNPLISKCGVSVGKN